MKTRLLLLLSLLTSITFAQTKEVELAENYFRVEDYEKAKVIYEKAIKNSQNVPHVYEHYRITLRELKEYQSFQKFVDKLSKRNPSNLLYKIDAILIRGDQSNDTYVYKEFEKLKIYLRSAEQQTKIAAGILQKRGQTDVAIAMYLKSRDALKRDHLYAKELAELYNYKGNVELMIDEYLVHIYRNRDDIESIQGFFQTELDEKGMNTLIDKLYEKVGSGSKQIYGQLLVWAYIQQKDFYNAFVQERSIDKQQKLGGTRLEDLGKLAVKNKDMPAALKIFGYLCDTYTDHSNYVRYKKAFINTKESVVLNKYPVDIEAVNALITDYADLEERAYDQNQKAQIQRSQARLHAFYLEDRLKAKELLKLIVGNTRVPRSTKSGAKLDLADIYLLENDPQAALLYMQVESEQNDNTIGHLAKLKNAKYWYYNGDFELAQAQLNILKHATSREIANNALDLAVLIQDNIGLDTTTEALKVYARADLYVFQHQLVAARQTLDSLRKTFPKHSLEDESHWLMAKIMNDQGQYEEALVHLNEIIDKFSSDIWGDNSIMMKADILDERLGQKKEAMQLYKKILIEYKGSIFKSEARMKYRKLRGDMVN
jgi:tetratricopeptide (TPR) repeat protein